eukprot:g8367.t1
MPKDMKTMNHPILLGFFFCLIHLDEPEAMPTGGEKEGYGLFGIKAWFEHAPTRAPFAALEREIEQLEKEKKNYTERVNMTPEERQRRTKVLEPTQQSFPESSREYQAFQKAINFFTVPDDQIKKKLEEINNKITQKKEELEKRQKQRAKNQGKANQGR